MRAGEEVWREQAFCRERCAVSTAAHWRRFGRDPKGFHGFKHQVDSAPLLTNRIADIALGIFNAILHLCRRMLPGNQRRDIGNLLLAGGKLCFIEITDIRF